MAAGNITGERFSTFLVDMAKTTRCLKGVKRILCCYQTQPKSWMLSELLKYNPRNWPKI